MNDSVADYAQPVQELLAAADLNPLGPGVPNENQLSALRQLDGSQLGGESSVSDRQMASCCLSGLWLLHNFLDESHSISQSIDTPSGSYWHAIMHRREPDFPNAKYWCRRVGEHPVFEQLPQAIEAQGSQLPTCRELDGIRGRWDSLRFVDLCEQASGNPSSELYLACQLVAKIEWQLLFDFCFQRAHTKRG